MKSIGMFFSLLVLGFALQYLGGKSNEFVMSQNGGRMPVWCIMEDMRLGAMFDPRHTVMDKDTEYPYLADYIRGSVHPRLLARRGHRKSGRCHA